MIGVIKRRKKSWFARIFGERKSSPLPHEQEGVANDVLLYNIRASDEEVATIGARREELRAARLGNSDAVVIFTNNRLTEDEIVDNEFGIERDTVR